VRQGLADKALKKRCTREEQDAYIAKIRDSVGDPSIWAQQFLCLPQDENETFISWPLLEGAGRAELLPIKELRECKELYGGLDIGRITNFSYLWISEKVTSSLFITRYLYAIQGEEFPKQERKIAEILLALPNIRRLCIDKTGVGWGLTEYLQEKFGKGRIEGVLFSAISKEQMAFRMRHQLEDGSFLIPADREIYDDFQLVKQTMTASGNVRLQAGTKNDSHADRFWAAALSLEAGSTEQCVTPAVHVASMGNGRTTRLDNILRGFSKD
jgi:phage FluMu gp28-like protein